MLSTATRHVTRHFVFRPLQGAEEVTEAVDYHVGKRSTPALVPVPQKPFIGGGS